MLYFNWTSIDLCRLSSIEPEIFILAFKMPEQTASMYHMECSTQYSSCYDIEWKDQI